MALSARSKAVQSAPAAESCSAVNDVVKPRQRHPAALAACTPGNSILDHQAGAWIEAQSSCSFLEDVGGRLHSLYATCWAGFTGSR